MIVQDRFSLPSNIRNILIVQLGDIGDVVWSIPTFHSVKNAYRQGHVSVLVRDGMKSLLEADPFLHKVYEIKKHPEGFIARQLRQMKLLMEMRSAGYDLIFDLRSDDRGAFMGYLTGAPLRASLYHPDASSFRNRLFTHLLTEPVPPKDRIHGAAEQSLRIVRGFGVETTAASPQLWVADRVKTKVNDSLLEEGLDISSSWVTLNPFSRWSYKEWAYDKWVSVIDWLWSEMGFAVVMVGAGMERRQAEELASKCGKGVYNMVGRTTLGELAGVLSLSRIHIGVDSAAPHIAAAVGSPTVTIYGPSDWRDWAPVGDRHHVIFSELDCVPCYKKGCEGSGISRCLENIDADRVTNVIREALT